METQRFCVYNQTSECFLSLGVTVVDTMLGPVKELLRRHPIHNDEGLWVAPSEGLRAVSEEMDFPLDFVYLDKDYRVLHVVESSSELCIDPSRMAAASALVLPVHTVFSSQTQPRNQLVICVAEALEFRLKRAAGYERLHEIAHLSQGDYQSNRAANLLPPGLSADRRVAPRQLWPKLVAYDWKGDNLAVYGIRDASATGLYLLTEKRWPLGTLVMMTLRRSDLLDEEVAPSITVKLRVMRWGPDGVGLQFVLPEQLDSTRWIDAGSQRPVLPS